MVWALVQVSRVTFSSLSSSVHIPVVEHRIDASYSAALSVVKWLSKNGKAANFYLQEELTSSRYALLIAGTACPPSPSSPQLADVELTQMHINEAVQGDLAQFWETWGSWS